MAKAPITHEADAPAAAPTSGSPTGLPAEAYLTEQEKGPPDPSDPPQFFDKPAELVSTPTAKPYPSGKPWATPTENVPMNQAPPAKPAA
jgi:hypothetical protein